MTDVQLVRMYETVRQLQAEKRCIKADPVEYALKVQAEKVQKERDDKLDAALKSDKPMTELVRDIEEVSLITKLSFFVIFTYSQYRGERNVLAPGSLCLP